jgi:hypothetical protein
VTSLTHFTDRECCLCEREVASRRLPFCEERTMIAVSVADIQFSGEFLG